MSEGNKRFKVTVTVDLTAIDTTQQFPESELTYPLSELDEHFAGQVQDAIDGLFARDGLDVSSHINVKHELVDA